MTRKRSNIIIAVSFIIAITIFVIYYPYKIQYDLEVAGKILPSEEMHVTCSIDGIISAVVTDNIRGLETSTFVTELERGDIVSLAYNTAIQTGSAIASGDTICWIQSQLAENELTSLQGDLAVERASLDIARTGQKESIIDEANRDLEAARELLTEQRNIVERQQNLLSQNLIPYQEYEQSMSQLTLYELAVEKAQSRLVTVQTGTTPQEIGLIEARIAAIQSEIDALSRKISRFHIVAPFTGTVLDPGTEANVVTVGNLSHMCVIIPIKLKNVPYIHQNQQVEYIVEGIAEPLHGEILNIGNVAGVTRDVQTVIATASIQLAGETLPVATIVRCNIRLEPVTLLEYCFRSVNTTFNR